jgi:hypothetical protein
MTEQNAVLLLTSLRAAHFNMLDALKHARAVCAPHELKPFTAGVGAVLGELYLSLVRPIESEYPHLEEPLPDAPETREAIERIRARLLRPEPHSD